MKAGSSKKVIRFDQDPEFFFRAGLRHAGRKSFPKSLKFLEKAAERDPYNADYQFNLACVLSELKETKKSNEILIGIIKNIDPTLGECYFGLGCNYFDLGDFTKAREYFEKYILHDAHGQFADETYDILYYLQIYDDVRTSSGSDRITSRLSNEVKKLVEQGFYERASRKLEKLVEINPDAVLPRNNLALACFFMGQTDRAISLAKSVLKLDKSNVFALCNLSLFYANLGKEDLFKKYLETLSKVRIRHPEDFMLDTGLFINAVKSDRNTRDSLKTAILEVLNLRRNKVEKLMKKNTSRKKD